MLIVVGALCVRQGRVLITQRPPGRSHAGMWEFPGGKVEAGESDEGALARELVEELSLPVRVGPRTHTVHHPGPGGGIELRVYLCEPLGEPSLTEASAALWLTPAELLPLELTPADVPVRADLVARGLPALPPTAQG